MAVEPLPQGCNNQVEGGRTEDLARVVIFVDEAISVEMRWEADEGRCLALSQALASNHHQATGERAEGEKPLLSHQGVTD